MIFLDAEADRSYQKPLKKAASFVFRIPIAKNAVLVKCTQNNRLRRMKAGL